MLLSARRGLATRQSDHCSRCVRARASHFSVFRSFLRIKLIMLSWRTEAFPQWRVGVATSTSALPRRWVPPDPTRPAAVLARHHEFDETWIEFEQKTADGMLDWSTSVIGEFVDSAGPPVVRRYGRGTGRTINRIVSYSGLAMMLFLDPVCVDNCIETAAPIARKHFVLNHTGEVTFVLFHPEDAPINGGIYQYFGLREQSQLPQVILVDSTDSDDSDGMSAAIPLHVK